MMCSQSYCACVAPGACNVAIGGALSVYPDDQCSPSSATYQCPSLPAISAHPCHLLVPISATLMPHISVYQCLPVHINSTYQCSSELPFSVTHQCQSVPAISAANQWQSVPPISVHQCHLSVPVSAAYQCRLTV
ncbi:unnamed protein product, partial [Staurois parvus]